MSWGEFVTLLSSLNGETPLGLMIQTRSESDMERLKHFTPAQRKVRRDWQLRLAKEAQDNEEVADGKIQEFQALMRSQFGGKNG